MAFGPLILCQRRPFSVQRRQSGLPPDCRFLESFAHSVIAAVINPVGDCEIQLPPIAWQAGLDRRAGPQIIDRDDRFSQCFNQVKLPILRTSTEFRDTGFDGRDSRAWACSVNDDRRPAPCCPSPMNAEV